jgi:D-alanyl-D-alanine carboxypeptidase (penicillin-binding protein 5/6)
MKKILIKTIITLYIFLPITRINALEIYSKNAILYNMNEDKIIYEKNIEEKTKVASLTKIMTTILALENIENIKEETIMPQDAFKDLDGYVTSGIKPNEKITYEDLLYGTMLPSAADCANALALKTSKNIDSFVELMNKKAQELNMNNTHFSNPIGMDEDNYSTVKDISILLKYALKNQQFYKIFTTKEYKTTNNITLESTLIEKSKPYNIDISTIHGSKTGFTDEAGNCLASITKINNVKYLLITTNADIQKSYHIMDAINIYNYYSENYSYKKILNYNQEIKNIKINNITNKEYKIKSDKDIYMYLNNNIDVNNLTYEYEGIKEITNKTNQDEPIGKLNIKNNNETIYTYNLYIDKKIEFYNLKTTIIYIILIIFTIIFIKKTNKKAKKYIQQKKTMIK